MQTETRIRHMTADITSLDVDAIVNAANSRLAGGGGVDGAIHRAAGDALYDACEKLGGCATGDAKITPGFRLKAKWIIHAVGPRYGSHQGKEDELLISCYQRSLEIARDYQLSSIAFPAISTGIYGFPKERAAIIAEETCKYFLSQNEFPREVILVQFPE